MRGFVCRSDSVFRNTCMDGVESARLSVPDACTENETNELDVYVLTLRQSNFLDKIRLSLKYFVHFRCTSLEGS